MSATNRGKTRELLDFYPTPRWLTKAILPYVVAPHIPMRILEPACGEGAISELVRAEYPNVTVTAFDIAPPLSVDFLTEPPDASYDLIITNPPYLLAQEFIERAMLWRACERSHVAMLLRLNFLGSQKRGAWLRAHTPSVYVSPRRPSFSADGKTDATEYAWFIWGAERPTLAILDTDKTAQMGFLL